MDNALLAQLCVAILPLIFAITLHEAAHGWVASKCGDTTALMLGRVTLNPMKHIDLIGTIILPIITLLIGSFIFGYAKPVPINWRHLKRPRLDMIFVAIAGPGANLIMALLWGLVARLTVTMPALNFFHLMGLFGIQINIFLLVLNLIPIPPLDGSRILSSLLPPRLAISYNKIEPYGIWILLLLIGTRLLNVVLLVPAYFLIGLITNLFGL